MDSAFDRCLADIDRIVTECRDRSDRAGYFAALYRNVTHEVRRGCETGRFADGVRMAEFTAAFAGRYIEAYDAHRQKRPMTASWAAAFAATSRRRPIVLQHLVLGMNAHINLDLGVVTADVADHYGLDSVRSDFHQINSLLADMITDCKEAICAVSPWIGLLDRQNRRGDTVLVRFSLERAREAAWHSAERLAPMSVSDRQEALIRLDAEVHRLSRIVAPGPVLLRISTWIVRLRERRSVREVIDVLSMPDGRRAN